MTTCVKEFAKFELNLDKSYFLLCNARWVLYKLAAGRFAGFIKTLKLQKLLGTIVYFKGFSGLSESVVCSDFRKAFKK